VTPRTQIHAALLMAVIAAIGGVAVERVQAAEPRILAVQLVGGDARARPVTLGVDKSVVIDLPRDIKDVLVASPAIANVVVRSSRRAYIIGVKVGQTNVFFLDADGKQMAGFDIAVTRDLNGLRAALKRAVPGTDVDIEGVGDGVELTGNVATPLEAQKAFNLASRLVGGNDKVVNDITVHGNDQVMLKVTVAEMDRTVIKQLGVNLNGSFSLGTSQVTFNNNNPFPVNGPLGINPFAVNGSTLLNNNQSCSISPCLMTPPNSPPGLTGTARSMTANLQAMEQVGVVRTLAEPTLTAISGESAHFLVGGQFPYPTPPSIVGGSPGFVLQPYGVQLNFTPVVLSEGRISLHVATEVSQLDPANSVTVAGTTVPGLTVRRADTMAEISSGGTFVMAGLLEEQTKQTITGVPGVMEVPILGALFKSRDYLNNETELVIMVTPYIAHAVARKDLSRPDDGFANPSDPASVLLGRLNRIYGVNASPPSLPYPGNIGFILD
jgi:pilus assembly protein CpaC